VTLTEDQQLAYRERAGELYAHNTDDVQIDEDAHVSEADHGAWVQAWVWVDDPIDTRPEEAEDISHKFADESYADRHRGFGSNVKPVRQP